MSPGGEVYIELRVSDTARTRIARAFTYTLESGFVRGDVTKDLELSLADPIANLFHLFQGASVFFRTRRMRTTTERSTCRT